MPAKDPEPKRLHFHDTVWNAATLMSFPETPGPELTAAIKAAEAVFAKARKLKLAN
ncbi:hypothetical protein QTI66_32685 [Variovorax sp. J22R133]|uniref:hypothetical protein n=1 Tax=Variovorax brevis TaxID=3053503 RepID=UPI002577EBB4|nr:hypothetical protein [Variovorax sp. J22R133]MDM0116885.1 hypothetical protein [Variovorax sp. J22R133]